MLTLEEAIASYEKSAERYHKAFLYCKAHGGEFYQSEAESNRICAEHDRQLAEWLRELKERRKAPEIIRCGECRHREILGVDGFCDHITGELIMVKKTDYCSWAEKKYVENG